MAVAQILILMPTHYLQKRWKVAHSVAVCLCFQTNSFWALWYTLGAKMEISPDFTSLIVQTVLLTFFSILTFLLPATVIPLIRHSMF